MPQGNNVFAGVTQAQLTAVDNVLYETALSTLKARKLIEPITLQPYQTSYSYRIVKRYGQAHWVGENANEQSTSGEDYDQEFRQISTYATGVSYTQDELLQSQAAGINLSTEQATTVGRAMGEFEERAVWLGDKDKKIPGLVGIADKERTDKATATFENMKPEDIYEYLRIQRNKLITQPGMNGIKPLLVLPVYAATALTKRYSDYDARPLSQVLADAGWFSSIETVDMLEQATGASKGCGLMFDASSTTMNLLIGENLNAGPVVGPNEDFIYKIPYRARTGGVVVRQPYHVLQMNGLE